MSVAILDKIQFKVLITNKQLVSLLALLTSKGVSISALSMGPVEECLFVVRFVTNNTVVTQQALVELGIEFITTVVLSLSASSISGGLQALFLRLYCYVTIIAVYYDSSLGLIIEFNNVELARRILSGTFPLCPNPIINNNCLINPCLINNCLIDPCLQKPYCNETLWCKRYNKLGCSCASSNFLE